MAREIVNDTVTRLFNSEIEQEKIKDLIDKRFRQEFYHKDFGYKKLADIFHTEAAKKFVDSNLQFSIQEKIPLPQPNKT